MSARPAVLLLSAYDAGSHRRWREGLARHVEADWTQRALPPRHFLWRTRGNPLWWAFAEAERLARPWDALVVPSTVDLATLRGLVPTLARVPTLAYFHENQLAYPDRRRGGEVDVNLALLDAYTALAADRVAFNSAFNRDTLLDGLDALLRRLPDAVPPGVVDAIARKSEVLPVPLEAEAFQPPAPREGPLQLVWNHRWEHDKAPERLFAALTRLAARGVRFTAHVVGQRFREVPAAFEAGRAALGDAIGTWGPVADRAEYVALLRRCDVVISTALHEFQGLAVLEARAAGCRAAAPDRLAYRETVPADERYPSHPDDAEAEADALAAHLAAVADDLAGLRARPVPPPTAWSWDALGARWSRAILGR